MREAAKKLGLVVLLATVCIVFGGPGAPVGDAAGAEREIVDHTVLKGDNLMLLAGYYFKDPRQWRRIYSRNTDVIKEPNLLIPGTVLKVSVVDTERWHIPYREFAARAGN